VKDLSEHDRAVEDAVTRVLQAEAAARAAVDIARADAAQLAEHARAQARDLAERSRDRLARVRTRVDDCVRRELAAVDAEVRALPEHDEPDAAARLRVEHAVRALAAALTGAREGPSW
jgi:hypothetical protein